MEKNSKKFVVALKNRLIGREVYRGILFIVHIWVYKDEIKSISFHGNYSVNNYYNGVAKTSALLYTLPNYSLS